MPVIEQAKGVLMAVFGLTEDAAFDVLRRSSQHRNVKVRDLAGEVTAALQTANWGTLKRTLGSVLSGKVDH